MIQELTVENLAIIDHARIDFSQGMNALTGETGAGKSLLIDAIGLALGGRADTELVRTGSKKATVCLVADLRSNLWAVARCAELGVDLEDGRLIVQREVHAEGRSSARINGRPVTVGTLKEIGGLIADLHGQHDHQKLLDPESQIQFLDQWIGDQASSLLADYADQYQKVESLKRRLSSLKSTHREREQRLDLLRFQIEEISDCSPTPGESQELEGRLARLKHAEKLELGVFAALENLSDDEDSAYVRLSTSIRGLEHLLTLDQSLEPTLQAFKTAMAALEDGCRELRAYSETVENDPAHIEELASRLDTLSNLKRKYGDTESAILKFLVDAEEELADLENQTLDASDLANQVNSEAAHLQKLANDLTELRRSRSVDFAREVTAHARELAMPNAEFIVRFSIGNLQSNGQDQVEFDFTSNSGEPPRPLAKVASGGELSRIMLAIKVGSNGRAGVPTLIFDEVDAGLSGRAAMATAKKLEQLACHDQVLVISHLPQIASRADSHFLIDKSTSNQRTITKIKLLTPEQRIQEIARMLAGDNIGDAALANARDLIQRPA